MRAKGEGTIRKRANGTWEARVQIGYDQNGKRIRKSVYGKTQAQVRRKKTELLANKPSTRETSMALSEWLDKWMSEYMPNIKQSTRRTYERVIRANINPVLGSAKINKLDTQTIQTFYRSLDLSPATVILIHGVVHKSLKKAVQLGLIKSNPSQGCEMKAKPSQHSQFLDDDDVKLFIRQFRSDKQYDIFMLYLLTGMRHAQMLSMTWDCVQFDQNRIYIYRQIDYIASRKQDSIVFTTLKSGKPRYIYPAQMAFDILQDVMDRQRSILSVSGGSNALNFVFTVPSGDPYGYKFIDYHFDLIRKRIGKPSVRLHDLRHAFATISIRNGDDVKTVSEMLGHASVAFTMDVYSHVTKSMHAASSERMQRYIEGAIDSVGPVGPVGPIGGTIGGKSEENNEEMQTDRESVE